MAMSDLDPGAGIGLLTNAPPMGLPAAELAAFSAVEICSRDGMAAHLAGRRDARAVVVDTAVVAGIEALDCPLAIVLRETPVARQAWFALPGGRPWDLVLVPNPGDHWLPDPVAVPAQRTEAVGWIYRSTPGVAERTVRPEVLVATGGGGTEDTAAAIRRQLDPVLAHAKALAGGAFDVVQALGPRAPAGARLDAADRTADPGGDLNHFFARADVVVSTAGYNSVLELATLDVPTMFVAIDRSIDDQAARARLWGARLGHCLDADATEAGAEWLAHAAIARRRRDPWDLGPSGGAAAARLLLDLGA